MPRRFVIFQFPNRPLLVAMATGALARTATGRLAHALALAADVALLVWAGEEVLDGANWFRRLVGLGGGALGVSDLRRQAASEVAAIGPVGTLAQP
jgi:hypothetical protein